MSTTARSPHLVLGDAPPAEAASSDRGTALALFGPLLLFVHGILRWVDAREAGRGPSWIAVLAGLTLVAGVIALALLADRLGPLHLEEDRGSSAAKRVADLRSAGGDERARDLPRSQRPPHRRHRSGARLERPKVADAAVVGLDLRHRRHIEDECTQSRATDVGGIG